MNIEAPTANKIEQQLKSLSLKDQSTETSEKLKGTRLSKKGGELIIGGVKHSLTSENLPTIRSAIKALPAPIRMFQRDHDNSVYNLEDHPDYPQGTGSLLITIKSGKQEEHSNFQTDTSATYLRGKDGYKFLTFPYPRKLHLIPRDNSAKHIYQGSIGYSEPGKGKLGTDNLQDCVALVMQDIPTKKMALAHVSVQTHRLVDEGLQTLPPGEKKIILIGARYQENTFNVDGIIKKFCTYPDKIHIEESYIFDGDYLINYSSMNDNPLPCGYVSCYETNTNFGTVMVDPDTLKITTVQAQCK